MMSSAEQLANAATILRATAKTYNTSSEEILAVVVTLSEIVYGILTTWSGLGHEAFLNAQKQEARDGYRARDALGISSTTLNAMAATIEDNLPAIRSAQAATQQATQGAVPANIAATIQAGQQAVDAIQQQAVTLSGALESDVMPLLRGGCSTGVEPLSGDAIDGVTRIVKITYVTTKDGYRVPLFTTEVLSSPPNGGGGGNGNNNGSSSNDCQPMQDIKDFLKGLKTNPLSAFKTSLKGLFWTTVSGFIAGGSNTTSAALQNHVPIWDPKIFTISRGNVIGGLFGPLNFAVATQLRKCIPLTNKIPESAYYTIVGSAFGGILEGGFLNYYYLNPAINKLFSPTPTATPTPPVTPTPTPTPTPTRYPYK